MNIAFDKITNERIEATPYIRSAICPLCNQEVIAKCGEIKVWHWAHKSNNECDSFGEPETEWHLNWKNEFPKENQEVIISENELLERDIKKHSTHDPDKKHRADVMINDLIIEFQNSPISPEQIMEREEFYDNMIWVFNGETLGRGINLRKRNNIVTFRWKNPSKSLWNCRKPIYFDFSNYNDKYKQELMERFDFPENEAIKVSNEKPNGILLIKTIYQNLPCGGWGKIISKEEFIKEVKNGVIKN
jgi:hypothetical protein